MIIRDMFNDYINRKINGVIKVNQSSDEVIEQEVREYVITKELKKHFISFFNYYGEAFENPTADMGVWISGFFGSGKSHFLKMLSYILENKEVDGKKTVEYFREKFSDDPATFMLIDNATRGMTETILFNIDIEGSINKDKTAVLRVFAKMFYSHLGYYGENLKVAMLEQYIEREGKTEEFRKAFEINKGKPWLEQRKAFAFNGNAIVASLMEALGMSEDDAKSWFKDKNSVEFSISQLVEDIKEYVDSKPKNFRLLFMIDEVGQYVGADSDLLINLQSIVEEIGRQCNGKVWVVCTGQEAIDNIIPVRNDEFSRIQARFKTRLSLTSSSVDEVVQKRILRKKPEIVPELEAIYEKRCAEINNLLKFKYVDGETKHDIKGYNSSIEFVKNYPFVPYQFILLQDVFNEIRSHGNVGKHQSNGERSMLSGFQEAAQKVQEKDEYTIVPFYLFYDTVHSFLDSSIRRVIERCQSAANAGDGIEQYDVNVLKLLYLLRYIEYDIKATIDNIVILMADNIKTDTIILRETVKNSINRLLDQNYIGRVDNSYHFLTDEEQDIQREIKNTVVDTSSIVENISKMIYGDIYQQKKIKYGRNDFPYDQMVDGVGVGALTGGMKLKFLTVATDQIDKSELKVMAQSKGEAIVVLAETPYYESIERAAKIRKYISYRNVAQLPKSVQDIIRNQQEEANKNEVNAKEYLKKAIIDAEFYVDGEHLTINGGDAKSKIDQAMEYLVAHVYSEVDLITKYAESDDDIVSALLNPNFGGSVPNYDAAAKIEEFLEMQHNKNLTTSMADIQSRYQAKPYGWREIDIAAVVALLIHDQKVTVKYAGNTIQPDNSRLPDMLRKKSEIGKTSISKRVSVNASAMKEARDFLRDYYDIMDIPSDEDGLISFIVKKFSEQKAHFEELLKRYSGKEYPDKHVVEEAIALTNSVLSQQKDNIALVSALIKKQDDLYDSKDQMQKVEEFFRSQVQIYDMAAKMLDDLKNENDYLSHDKEAYDALNRIRLLLFVNPRFDYKSIPELNTLMDKVREGHAGLLDGKRKELIDMIHQCLGQIHTRGEELIDSKDVIGKADTFYEQQKARIRELNSIALLDGLIPGIVQYKDKAIDRIEFLLKPPVTDPKPNITPAPKKVIKSYNRQVIFPAKTIESEEELDKYIENIRSQLKMYMQNCDGIELK